MFFFSLRRTFLAVARVLGGIRSLRLLLAGHGALRALAGARVGLGALPADREALAVAATLVAADLDLATDVGLDLTAEVTLDLVLRLDRVAELDELGVTQLVDPQVGADAGVGEELLGGGAADAVDVGERDLDALVAREVDTNEACHVGLPSRAEPSRGSQRCRSCRVPAVLARAPAVCSGGGFTRRGRASDHDVWCSVVVLQAAGGLSPGAACDAGSRRSP